MSGNCLNCGNRAELNEDNLCQNCQSSVNQQKVIQNISDGFTIDLDRGGINYYDEYLIPEQIGYGNFENFAEIFQAIRNYIRTHSNEFRLGGNESTENIHDGFLAGETSRPWWSPLLRDIPGEGDTGRSAGSHGSCNTRKIIKGNFFIHPDALTGEQYEELKQLIPGTCRVRGCFNEYPDPTSHDIQYSMAGDVCQFHSIYTDHRPPFFPGKTYNRTPGPDELRENQNNQSQNDNLNNEQYTPPPQQDNNNLYNEEEVINYNVSLIGVREKLEEEKEEIIFQGQEKFALLMSLEKENEVGVRENLDIINDENQPTLNLLEKFEDPARHADNQQREVQNETQINNYKNWLANKKEAVKKLEVIINQINQQKPTNETPEPTQQSPTEREKKENPVAENNKKSNENIEELSHLSLTEAKSKAKEEINILLERYGVKSSELDTKIWEGTESWEKYLESLSDNEKVEKFVKKTKASIIQQNNKNKQRLSKLSLEEVKQECKNQIKDLLQKYSGSGVNPESLDKKLWNNEENWEKYLEKLTDKDEVLNFAHKMREAIIYKKISQSSNKNKKDLSDKKKKIPLPLILIPTFVLLSIFLLGGLIIILKRKKIRKIR